MAKSKEKKIKEVIKKLDGPTYYIRPFALMPYAMSDEAVGFRQRHNFKLISTKKGKITFSYAPCDDDDCSCHDRNHNSLLPDKKK